MREDMDSGMGTLMALSAFSSVPCPWALGSQYGAISLHQHPLPVPLASPAGTLESKKQPIRMENISD